MNKRLQKALIEIILYMASMLMYQGNIFGTDDLQTLNTKIKELIEASEAY